MAQRQDFLSSMKQSLDEGAAHDQSGQKRFLFEKHYFLHLPIK